MTARNQKSNSFVPDDALIREWYFHIQKDNGARARLRRCRNPTDAVFTAGYHRLIDLVLKAVQSKKDEASELTDPIPVVTPDLRFRLAVVAVILAHVQSHQPARSIGAFLGGSRGGGPALSELRFRRLLSCVDLGELFTPMLRTVRMYSGADVTKLAHDLLYWGDKTRRQWANDYFENHKEK